MNKEKTRMTMISLRQEFKKKMKQSKNYLEFQMKLQKKILQIKMRYRRPPILNWKLKLIQTNPFQKIKIKV